MAETESTTGRAGSLWIGPLRIGLLAAAVGLLFGRTVGYGFLAWDDALYIARNPALHSPVSTALRMIFTPGTVEWELLYIPVTYASLLAEVKVFGMNPHVMHAVNVLLHFANAALVYRLLSGLIRRRWLAFLGAMAFAIHPLQVETVVWLMGRKDLLSCFFGLASTLAWRRWRDGGRVPWYALSLAGFALGVLSKPSLIVLPVALLVLEVGARGRPTRTVWRALAPFGAVMIAAIVMNSLTRSIGQEDVPPLGFRLLCIPWLGWHWATRLLLLAPTEPYYVWPRVGEAGAVLAKGLPIAAGYVALVVVAMRRGWRRLWTGLVVTAVLALPAIGILVRARGFVTADRYGYVPLVAVFALVAAIPLVVRPAARRLALGALVVWVLAGGILAFPEVGLWSDSLTVWDRMLADHPEMDWVRSNRANTLAEAGRYEEAIGEYERLLEATPDDADLRVNVGLCLLDAGRPERALRVLDRAFVLQPRDAGACVLRGRACAALRRFRDAARWFRLSLAFDPENRYAREQLARSLDAARREPLPARLDEVAAERSRGMRFARAGERERAIEHLRRAAAIPSDQDADLYVEIARLLVSSGRPQEARAAVWRALWANPRHAAARRLLERLE